MQRNWFIRPWGILNKFESVIFVLVVPLRHCWIAVHNSFAVDIVQHINISVAVLAVITGLPLLQHGCIFGCLTWEFILSMSCNTLFFVFTSGERAFVHASMFVLLFSSLLDFMDLPIPCRSSTVWIDNFEKSRTHRFISSLAPPLFVVQCTTAPVQPVVLQLICIATLSNGTHHQLLNYDYLFCIFNIKGDLQNLCSLL